MTEYDVANEAPVQGRCSHRSWGVMTPPLFEAKGDGGTQFGNNSLNDALIFWITTKLTLKTKITTENISISVSQLQIKQRN